MDAYTINEELKRLKICVCKNCHTIFKEGFAVQTNYETIHSCSKECTENILKSLDENDKNSVEIKEVKSNIYMDEFFTINNKLFYNNELVYYNDFDYLKHNINCRASIAPTVHLPVFDIYDVNKMIKSEKEELANLADFSIIELYPKGKDKDLIKETYGVDIYNRIKNKEYVCLVYDLQKGSILEDIDTAIFEDYDEALMRIDHYFDDFDILVFYF